MKYLIPLVTSLLLSTHLAAEQSQQQIDLEVRSISYVNESIPTVSIDLCSKDMKEIAFVIAYANNYFEVNKTLIDEQNREHIYIGFNYNF